MQRILSFILVSLTFSSVYACEVGDTSCGYWGDDNGSCTSTGGGYYPCTCTPTYSWYVCLNPGEVEESSYSDEFDFTCPSEAGPNTSVPGAPVLYCMVEDQGGSGVTVHRIGTLRWMTGECPGGTYDDCPEECTAPAVGSNAGFQEGTCECQEGSTKYTINDLTYCCVGSTVISQGDSECSCNFHGDTGTTKLQNYSTFTFGEFDTKEQAMNVHLNPQGYCINSCYYQVEDDGFTLLAADKLDNGKYTAYTDADSYLATGEDCVASPVSDTELDSSVEIVINENLPDDCIYDDTGKIKCVQASDNSLCITLEDGSEVCQSDDFNLPNGCIEDTNGDITCTDKESDKICLIDSNGNEYCSPVDSKINIVQTDPSSGVETSTEITANPDGSTVQKDTTTETTTNPDGSITTITTITTTTTYTDGSTETTTVTNTTNDTSGSDLAGVEGAIKKVEQAVNKAGGEIQDTKEAVDGVKTSVDQVKGSVDGVKESVDGIKDALTGTGTGSYQGKYTSTVGAPTGSGIWGGISGSAEFQTASGELRAAYTSIYNEARGFIQIDGIGEGSLPCLNDPVELPIFGTLEAICLGDYENYLEIFKQGIFIFVTVICAFIILGGVRNASQTNL